PLIIHSKKLANRRDNGDTEILADALPNQETFTIVVKGNIQTVEQTVDFENALQLALLSGKDVIIYGAKIKYLSMSAIASLLTFHGKLQQKQNEMLLKHFSAKAITLLRLCSVIQIFKLT